MSETIPEELIQCRAEIDALDVELIDILARRFDVVRRVGALKAREGVQVVQSQRAEAVKDRTAEMGAAKGLDPEFVRALYEAMIDHAHVLEHKIADE